MTRDEMLICRAAAGLLERWAEEHRDDEPQVIDGYSVSYMTTTASHAATEIRVALVNIQLHADADSVQAAA
jgi:hypothetical protein